LECLNDTTVQQLLDGTLTEAQTRDAQVHLDTCRSCRVLLSTLAMNLSAPAGPGPEDIGSVSADGSGTVMPRLIAPGTRIGRFVVQSPLGAGGMGVVYPRTIRCSGARWRSS